MVIIYGVKTYYGLVAGATVSLLPFSLSSSISKPLLRAQAHSLTGRTISLSSNRRSMALYTHLPHSRIYFSSIRNAGMGFSTTK